MFLVHQYSILPHQFTARKKSSMLYYCLVAFRVITFSSRFCRPYIVGCNPRGAKEDSAPLASSFTPLGKFSPWWGIQNLSHQKIHFDKIFSLPSSLGTVHYRSFFFLSLNNIIKNINPFFEIIRRMETHFRSLNVCTSKSIIEWMF